MTTGLEGLPLGEYRGSTFDAARDRKRLNEQSQRVFNYMKSGEWRTLKEISAATGDPEASVSARLRDLRRWGYVVQRKHIANGLHAYRVVVS